jgi:hypothetical protein
VTPLGGRPEFREKLDRTADIADDTQLLLALLENITTVEDWTDEQIELPEEISAEEANNVALCAVTIRTRELPVRFEKATMHADATAIKEL